MDTLSIMVLWIATLVNVGMGFNEVIIGKAYRTYFIVAFVCFCGLLVMGRV